MEEKGRYGYVDLTGRMAIPCVWDEAGEFEDGRAQVVKRGRTICLDVNGNELEEETWRQDLIFSEGLAPRQEGSLYGFVNEEGETVIAPAWEKTGRFHDGLCAVMRDRVPYDPARASG